MKEPTWLTHHYLSLNCEWEDEFKTAPLWKYMRFAWLLYSPAHQFKNTDLDKTKLRWFQILRAVR